jgi:hypothetical protein
MRRQEADQQTALVLVEETATHGEEFRCFNNRDQPHYSRMQW